MSDMWREYGTRAGESTVRAAHNIRYWAEWWRHWAIQNRKPASPAYISYAKFSQFLEALWDLDPETVQLPSFSILSAMFTGACGPPDKLSLALVPRSNVLRMIMKLAWRSRILANCGRHCICFVHPRLANVKIGLKSYRESSTAGRGRLYSAQAKDRGLSLKSGSVFVFFLRCFLLPWATCFCCDSCGPS